MTQMVQPAAKRQHTRRKHKTSIRSSFVHSFIRSVSRPEGGSSQWDWVKYVWALVASIWPIRRRKWLWSCPVNVVRRRYLKLFDLVWLSRFQRLSRSRKGWSVVTERGVKEPSTHWSKHLETLTTGIRSRTIDPLMRGSSGNVRHCRSSAGWVHRWIKELLHVISPVQVLSSPHRNTPGPDPSAEPVVSMVPPFPAQAPQSPTESAGVDASSADWRALTHET